MFLNHLYAGTDEPELKILDVFVAKLRKKIAQATGGKHYIETVWGRGYMLRDRTPPEPPAQVVRLGPQGTPSKVALRPDSAAGRPGPSTPWHRGPKGLIPPTQ